MHYGVRTARSMIKYHDYCWYGRHKKWPAKHVICGISYACENTPGFLLLESFTFLKRTYPSFARKFTRSSRVEYFLRENASCSAINP
ncbi:uncharacterized protein PHALS_10638 [Plasmopara halstedii]|uniref:Uncharacterized protein n=1 Tax=Plasmopara halstedii TaxID=4781 RepID=A0A0P1A4R6_PLAHL|nr:uncharacterized protein PHALS_10638 [Plasmopara halstedii]CEG35066.1 hypothetical protein PHALS_10638 [Plasmopara halstedii]|eukprot:XP_024571435.1 hypothetical protein PHALS_10638 [Plasmopara halstedii]